MTEFESLQDNVVSASTEETIDFKSNLEDIDDHHDDVSEFTLDEKLSEPIEPEFVEPIVEDKLETPELEEAEALPSSTTGVEDVLLVSLAPETDDAIVDGFPAQSTKPHVMNGSATPSPSTPTPDEGFEELVPQDEEPLPVKKDDSLKSPLALWMVKQNLHPQVVQLIYWVEVQRTTGVFGGILFLLLSLRFYSVIGVATTFALSLLVIAFLYRIGMTIVKAVQKTSAEHPFKHLLEEKIEVSDETVQRIASEVRLFVNEKIRQAQCLFLVKDTVMSLKAMVVFWLVSYVASCIDLLTIGIMGVVALFTLPKLYEEKQAEIDQVCSLVMSKTCMVCSVIEQKLPEKIKIYLKKDKTE